MKAITVCQPYAHLICLPESDPRHKRVENRSRRWQYRGPIAIHAGKSHKMLMRPGDNYGIPIEDMAFGAVVATARLSGCYEIAGKSIMATGTMTVGSMKFSGVVQHRTYSPQWAVEQWPWLDNHQHVEGPYCLVLTDVKPLKTPVPWRGSLGLFEIPDDVITAPASNRA